VSSTWEKVVSEGSALDWFDAAAAAAQAAAIVIGGVWAYFKFMRGRTFAKRAEVTVKAIRLALPDGPGLKVAVTLRNVGLSKLPLRYVVLAVHEIRASPREDDSLATEQRKLGKRQEIFTAHEWVEAQETISDEAVIALPVPDDAASLLGYRVECEAVGGREGRGGLGWSASTVVSPWDETAVESLEEQDVNAADVEEAMGKGAFHG
jgi:hypothetical protein